MRKFTLELNTAKKTPYIKKCFKQKLHRIKFVRKTRWTHISIYFRSGDRGLQRFVFLKNYNALQ